MIKTLTSAEIMVASPERLEALLELVPIPEKPELRNDSYVRNTLEPPEGMDLPFENPQGELMHMESGSDDDEKLIPIFKIPKVPVLSLDEEILLLADDQAHSLDIIPLPSAIDFTTSNLDAIPDYTDAENSIFLDDLLGPIELNALDSAETKHQAPTEKAHKNTHKSFDNHDLDDSDLAAMNDDLSDG